MVKLHKLWGNVKWSQIVGFALHANPDPSTIPCHRAVNRNGEICAGFALGGANEQRKLLENEKIKFTADGKIDLEKYLWSGN